MKGLPSILSLFRNEFNKFNKTRARMLDSIYHTRVIFYVRRIGLYLYKYRIYGTISIHILKGLAFVYQLM